jgi:hypothetical protein
VTKLIRAALRLLLLAQAAMLVAFSPAYSQVVRSGGCSLSASDRAFLDGAFAGWAFVAKEKLNLGDVPLPRIFIFDQRCLYMLSPGPNRLRPWQAKLHGGRIRLPDGLSVPAAPVSYAGTARDTGAAFLVMSLPAVWRAAGQSNPLGLEPFLQGVMIHELTHTSQFHFARPALNALRGRYGLAGSVTDESLQEAFKRNAAYVAAFESERDLLLRAAAAPDDRQARTLACEAREKMRSRRSRFFRGANAKWGPLDEIYLTMEGQGQYAMYSWWTDPKGKGAAPAAVMPNITGGGASWVQEESLALFLVIDRLVPGWQRSAFVPRPETATALLARACGR